MKRRDMLKSSLAASAAAALTRGARLGHAAPGPAAEFPKAPGLTKSVAEFIVGTKYKDIPPDVIELGKKSILDGFGLALAGSVSAMAPLTRQYVQSLGSAPAKASIIGTGIKCHPRFAAFANGVWIHADDYDDTQLAVAKDRIYGLLTHPTVPVLPPVFALCEIGRRAGRDFMLAYHVGVEVECKIAEAIKIHLKDGKVLSGRADFAKGSPANPMSYDEVAGKFRGCAEFAKWPAAKAEVVIATVKSLESLSDVGKISAALTT